MLYDYECSHCGHRIVDYYQSIHDDPITLCNKCNNDSLNRVITGGLGSFCKDAKTIGQLADSNWSKMGSYKRSEIAAKSKNSKQQSASFFDQFGSANKKEINKMTQEQQKKYIITGEK
jgi:putative FmdB family regulatory protein